MKKLIVEIPKRRDNRWKAWRRHVTGVDTTKTNGYAFQGEFLPAGRLAELEVGSLLLQYDEVGSRAYHPPEVKLLRLSPEGEWEELASAIGRSWALELRDITAQLLAKQRSQELAETAALSPEEEQVLKALLALPAERRLVVTGLALSKEGEDESQA